MSTYLILLAADPTEWNEATAEERRGYVDAHRAFDHALAAAGRMICGAALADA